MRSLDDLQAHLAQWRKGRPAVLSTPLTRQQPASGHISPVTVPASSRLVLSQRGRSEASAAPAYAARHGLRKSAARPSTWRGVPATLSPPMSTDTAPSGLTNSQTRTSGSQQSKVNVGSYADRQLRRHAAGQRSKATKVAPDEASLAARNGRGPGTSSPQSPLTGDMSRLPDTGKQVPPDLRSQELVPTLSSALGSSASESISLGAHARTSANPPSAAPPSGSPQSAPQPAEVTQVAPFLSRRAGARLGSMMSPISPGCPSVWGPTADGPLQGYANLSHLTAAAASPQCSHSLLTGIALSPEAQKSLPFARAASRSPTAHGLRVQPERRSPGQGGVETTPSRRQSPASSRFTVSYVDGRGPAEPVSPASSFAGLTESHGNLAVDVAAKGDPVRPVLSCPGSEAQRDCSSSMQLVRVASSSDPCASGRVSSSGSHPAKEQNSEHLERPCSADHEGVPADKQPQGNSAAVPASVHSECRQSTLRERMSLNGGRRLRSSLSDDLCATVAPAAPQPPAVLDAEASDRCSARENEYDRIGPAACEETADAGVPPPELTGPYEVHWSDSALSDDSGPDDDPVALSFAPSSPDADNAVQHPGPGVALEDGHVPAGSHTVDAAENCWEPLVTNDTAGSLLLSPGKVTRETFRAGASLGMLADMPLEMF